MLQCDNATRPVDTKRGVLGAYTIVACSQEFGALNVEKNKWTKVRDVIRAPWWSDIPEVSLRTY